MAIAKVTDKDQAQIGTPCVFDPQTYATQSAEVSGY